jgi:peptidoglycan hydrolase CwlO-like protein
LQREHAIALDDHIEIKTTLEADIVEHERTLKDERALLESMRVDFEDIVGEKDFQIATLGEHQANLEAQLTDANATASAIQEELLGANERIRERDESIAALQADMRMRDNNLKRIFKKPEF